MSGNDDTELRIWQLGPIVKQHEGQPSREQPLRDQRGAPEEQMLQDPGFHHIEGSGSDLLGPYHCALCHLHAGARDVPAAPQFRDLGPLADLDTSCCFD